MGQKAGGTTLRTFFRGTGSAAADRPDDFDPVAVAEPMAVVPAARHDFPIDLDRDAAIGEAGAEQQSGYRLRLGEFASLAIEGDLHSQILARCERSGRRFILLPEGGCSSMVEL